MELLRVKKITLNYCTKYFLTLNLNNVLGVEDVMYCYDELYKYIRENDIKIVYEKVFGRLFYKDAFMDGRNNVCGKYNLEKPPVTYIEGLPVTDGYLSSIIIFGVQSHTEGVCVKYVRNSDNGKCVGSLLQTNGNDYLFLNELKADISENPVTIEKEMALLYQSVEDYLIKNDFTPHDIVRTWIYLNDIQKDYAQLNTARRNFFKKYHIDYSAESDVLPASTGIQGRTSGESTVCMDLFCVNRKKQKPFIQRIRSKCQNEPDGENYLYKSTFSRGMLLDDGEHVEIQLSGTASINERGETVFIGEPYKQIKKTLLNIATILEQFNLEFEDICQSTCFFKKKEYYQEYLKIIKDLKLTDFCDTFVIGDICRDELLFEFDGIAMSKKENILF